MTERSAIAVVGRWWKGRQAELVRELRRAGHQVAVFEADEGPLVELCAGQLAGVVDLDQRGGASCAAAQRLGLARWHGLYAVPASERARPPVAVMVAGRLQGRTLGEARCALVARGLTTLVTRRELLGVCDALIVGARPGRWAEEARAAGVAVMDEAALEALLGGADPMAVLARARGHSGAEQLALARLRELLHEPPSQAVWERLCAWLERCPEGVAPLATAYAAEHLAGWDAARDGWVERDLRGCGLWGEVWDVAEGWDAPEAFGVAPLRGEAPTLWAAQVERGRHAPHHAAARRWTLKLEVGAPVWPAASLEGARALAVHADRQAGFADLARMPWPSGLVHLALRGARWGVATDEDARAWRGRGPLAPLRSLAMYDCGAEPSAWRLLGEAGALGGLRRLELAAGRFGRRAQPERIAASLPTSALAGLSAVSITDARAWPLDAWVPRLSPKLDALRLSVFADAEYAAQLWRALGRFEALRWLELARIYAPSAAHSAFDQALAEDAPWARAVAKFNFSGNGSYLTPARLALLMRAPLAEGLTHLGLVYNGLGPSAAARIVDGAARATLEWLDLAHNPLGRAGAEAIARARWPRLRALNLSGAQLTDEGAERLARSPGLDALEVLVLREDRYSGEVLDAMRARGWRVIVSEHMTPATGRRLGG